MTPNPVPSSRILRLYFDDSGQRQPDVAEGPRDDGIDGFSLGGVLVEDEFVPEIYERHRSFVARWRLGGPLHSTKIRGYREQFRWLRLSPERDAFFAELEDFLLGIPVIGIACAIDRPGYNARYRHLYGNARWKMCKTALSILVERSTKRAIATGRKLSISFEESGEREDRDIVDYIRALKSEGMPFNSATSRHYDSLGAEDFRAHVLGDPERITKKSGLAQIADLYLYPMVKGGYDSDYAPYQRLKAAGRLIDCHLAPDEIAGKGIKYSCFETRNEKGPGNPSLFRGPQMADPGASPTTVI